MADRENRKLYKQPSGSRGKIVLVRLSSLQSISQAVGIIAMLVGCFVLLGWTLEIDVLKRVLPGLVAMNPTTAIAFVLAGASLLLLRVDQANRRFGRTGSGLALAVALLGLLKLVEVLSGWNLLGIDQLLFGQQLEAEAAVTGLPNRMAPNTALGFLLVGSALLFLDSRTRRGHYYWPAQYLILIVGATSLVTLIGYIYGVGALYGVASHIPMALHTALAFLVLVVGILCARPDLGLAALLRSDTMGGVVARRLLPAAVFVPAVLGWLRLEGERAGLYETEVGVALMVVISIAILAAVAGVSARLIQRTDTERRRAEEARSLLAAIIESSDDAVIGQTLEGIITSWNVGAERLYGYLEEEVLGKPLSILVPSDRSDEIPTILEKVGRLEHLNHYEAERVKKDGTRVHVSITVSPIRDFAGNIVGVSTVARDVTARKRAEEALRKSEARTRAIVDTASDAIITMRADGLIRSFNGAAERIFGYAPQEAVGQPLRILMPERLRGPHEAGFRRYLKTGEARVIGKGPVELAGLRKNGEEFPLELSLGVVREEDDMLFTGIIREITERKEAEEKIRHLNESLEEQVAERTAELIESERRLKGLVGKLVGAQEEERRRVAYEVHDGPTQVAVATHQHLQAFAHDHPPDSTVGMEKLNRALELAQRTVKETRHIIENLRPTALDDFGLASAVRLQLEELEREGWQIDYEEALGDESLSPEAETVLYRVAQEALTNIRKHAYTTKVRVKLVRLKEKVHLEVRDEGHGFDLSASKEGSGRGERVGLRSMQERLGLLGGELKITSGLGVGTSVVAEVPLPPSRRTEGDGRAR